MLDEVVEKREQMNDNDRQFALRIYQENMRDVMDYRIERDKKITEERRQKLDEKRVKKSGKDVKVSENNRNLPSMRLLMKWLSQKNGP